jgi:flagellin-specific chaperone FliS
MYWAERYSHLGKLVRYADDLVVICKTQGDAEEALQKVKQIMTRLKLTLHPTKTRIVDMGQGGFDFLGFHFHKMKTKKTHKLLPYMWPGQKAMKAVRRKIHEITMRKRLSNPLEEVIRFLNMIIRGWRNYFRIGNSTTKLQELDLYVRQRLQRWVRAQKGSRGHWNERGFELLIAQSGLEHFYRSGICDVRP